MKGRGEGAGLGSHLTFLKIELLCKYVGFYYFNNDIYWYLIIFDLTGLGANHNGSSSDTTINTPDPGPLLLLASPPNPLPPPVRLLPHSSNRLSPPQDGPLPLLSPSKSREIYFTCFYSTTHWVYINKMVGTILIYKVMEKIIIFKLRAYEKCQFHVKYNPIVAAYPVNSPHRHHFLPTRWKPAALPVSVLQVTVAASIWRVIRI